MKNLFVIAFVAWLLFFNGLSLVTSFTKTAPAVITTGVQRVQQQPIQQQQPVQPVQPVQQAQVVPTLEPTAVPTVYVPPVYEPTLAPQVAAPTLEPTQVIVIPATRIPVRPMTVPTLEPLPTAKYPTAAMVYEVRENRDKGYPQDCVYVYTLHKRSCWSPGIHPSESDARWIVGMMEAGYIVGEPFND